MAQHGSAHDWGSWGRWFKSSQPDHCMTTMVHVSDIVGSLVGYAITVLRSQSFVNELWLTTFVFKSSQPDHCMASSFLESGLQEAFGNDSIL